MEILNYLTEKEEQQLADSIKENKNLFLFKIAFTIENLDDGLSAFYKKYKMLGEIIIALPSAEETPNQRITFLILLATDLSFDELQSKEPIPPEVKVIQIGKS